MWLKKTVSFKICHLRDLQKFFAVYLGTPRLIKVETGSGGLCLGMSETGETSSITVASVRESYITLFFNWGCGNPMGYDAFLTKEAAIFLFCVLPFTLNIQTVLSLFSIYNNTNLQQMSFNIKI